MMTASVTHTLRSEYMLKMLGLLKLNGTIKISRLHLSSSEKKKSFAGADTRLEAFNGFLISIEIKEL